MCCQLKTATVERSSTARASRREDSQQLRIPCRSASSTCGRDHIWASRNRPRWQRRSRPYASLSRVIVVDLGQAAAQFRARACQIRTVSRPNGRRRGVRRTAASARRIRTYTWRRGRSLAWASAIRTAGMRQYQSVWIAENSSPALAPGCAARYALKPSADSP